MRDPQGPPGRHRRQKHLLILLAATISLRLQLSIPEVLVMRAQAPKCETEFAFQFSLGTEVFGGPVELLSVGSEGAADLFCGCGEASGVVLMRM